MKDDDKYFKYMEEDGTIYVKESIFSCIRPIDGTTRLIVYASSNIIGLEGIVYRTCKVGVEVPDGCMIVFTSDTFHVGLKSYERQSGVSSSYLRMFTYIIESNYISIKIEVLKLLNDNKYIGTCATCEAIPNENIHYEGHIIKYLDTQHNINNLPMGKLLLEDL